MKKFILILSILILPLSFFTSICAQWTQLISGTTNTLEEIYFPVADTGYAVGETGTILKTIDGLSWTSLSTGSNADLKDVFFIDSQTGFIVGDSGIFAQTQNGGANWNVQYLSNIGFILLNTVFFIDVDTGFAAGSENYSTGIIFKTIDGGNSWTVVNTPTSSLDVNYKRIVFPDALTGYAVTRGWCIKTTDGGNNWAITDTSLFSAGNMFSLLEDAYFFSADTGYIVGWYNPFTGYTNNGGASWVDLSLGQWFSIDFPSKQTGYIVGWGQLVKTKDGGVTWNDISSTEIMNNSLYSIDFTDDVTGYACGENGLIIKTTNGCITSVDELKNYLAVKVSPNPSNGNFEIEFLSLKTGNAKFELINMLGEIISIHSVLVKTGTNKIKFEVENATGGIYFVNVILNENNFRAKIVIN